MNYTLEELAQLPPEELNKIPTSHIFAAAEKASAEEIERAQELSLRREIISEKKMDYTSQKLRGYNGNYST